MLTLSQTCETWLQPHWCITLRVYSVYDTRCVWWNAVRRSRGGLPSVVVASLPKLYLPVGLGVVVHSERTVGAAVYPSGRLHGCNMRTSCRRALRSSPAVGNSLLDRLLGSGIRHVQPLSGSRRLAGMAARFVPGRYLDSKHTTILQ